jgi:hypothetical protein
MPARIPTRHTFGTKNKARNHMIRLYDALAGLDRSGPAGSRAAGGWNERLFMDGVMHKARRVHNLKIWTSVPSERFR